MPYHVTPQYRKSYDVAITTHQKSKKVMEDNKFEAASNMFEDLTSSGKKIQKDTRKREKGNAGRYTKKASKANYAKKGYLLRNVNKVLMVHHHHQIARKPVPLKERSRRFIN